MVAETAEIFKLTLGIPNLKLDTTTFGPMQVCWDQLIHQKGFCLN